MLSALIEDFSKVHSVSTSCLVQTAVAKVLERRSPFGLGKLELFETTSKEEPEDFRDLAREADYTLVIAPEMGGFLHERCSWVEELGGRLLGPNSEAVRLTADKLELASFLKAKHIPTPPWFPAKVNSGCPFPAVLKPRDGAGSQATILVKREQDVEQAIETVRTEGWAGELLLQPIVAGIPCSLSFLIGGEQIEPLLPASQELTDDGRFRYQGGVLPLPPPLSDRAVRLATQAIYPVSGLRGYVGVDMILGKSADGTEDQVIEINPRMTTSYVGLRALAKTNLAEAMIQIAEGKRIEPVNWKTGKLLFRPDGRVVSCREPP
ncbi:MAG TPA: ATP-grasp domain-containing protein [Gemmataceae bacterium]|nr:ATP-grasp domain-containing protein [Gemmataceae bacterium]